MDLCRLTASLLFASDVGVDRQRLVDVRHRRIPRADDGVQRDQGCARELQPPPRGAVGTPRGPGQRARARLLPERDERELRRPRARARRSSNGRCCAASRASTSSTARCCSSRPTRPATSPATPSSSTPAGPPSDPARWIRGDQSARTWVQVPSTAATMAGTTSRSAAASVSSHSASATSTPARLRRPGRSASSAASQPLASR